MSLDRRDLDSATSSKIAPGSGPIFIGGTGRCGTTVLVRALGLHSRIHSFRWETQFVVSPNGLLNLARNGYRQEEVRQFLDDLRGRWFSRTITRAVKGGGSDQPQIRSYSAGLTADVEQLHLEDSIDFLQARLRSCGTEMECIATARAFIDFLFAPTLDRAEANRWSEKTPRNVLFADRLFELYPSCRFIHIVRDGRDVVSSMLQKKFWPIAAGRDFPELAEFRRSVSFKNATRYWVRVLEMASEIQMKVPGRNYLKIRLENLATNPEETLETVTGFLGEELENRLLKQNFSRANSGRWKRDLTPAQVHWFSKVAGPTMEREGYTEGL